jgi:methionine-rich copper-binding protein CopC
MSPRARPAPSVHPARLPCRSQIQEPERRRGSEVLSCPATGRLPSEDAPSRQLKQTSGAAVSNNVSQVHASTGHAPGSSPRVIALEYTEPLIGRLTSRSHARCERPTRAGDTTSSGRPGLTARPDEELRSGAYRVEWHTVSTEDGHALEGSSRRRPCRPSPPMHEETPSTPPAPTNVVHLPHVAHRLIESSEKTTLGAAGVPRIGDITHSRPADYGHRRKTGSVQAPKRPRVFQVRGFPQPDRGETPLSPPTPRGYLPG